MAIVPTDQWLALKTSRATPSGPQFDKLVRVNFAHVRANQQFAVQGSIEPIERRVRISCATLSCLLRTLFISSLLAVTNGCLPRQAWGVDSGNDSIARHLVYTWLTSRRSRAGGEHKCTNKQGLKHGALLPGLCLPVPQAGG
jgi:hypothetical protein